MSAPVCTIAVIVPVHNAAKYLPDCLDAIAAQQFDAFCRPHRRAAPGTGDRGRVDRVLRCG